MGSAIAAFLAFGKTKDKDDIDVDNKLYTDRDYHYDHPCPNDDWPDTAY